MQTDLQSVLADLGWSQAELARRIECSETSITNWKRRGAPMSVLLYLDCMRELREIGDRLTVLTRMPVRGQRKAHRLRLAKTAEELAQEAERIHKKGL